MNDAGLHALVWHGVWLALVWVPFAVSAGIVDHWDSADMTRWRANVTHPFRAAHDWRAHRAHHAHA